jgi:hypothetical protein
MMDVLCPLFTSDETSAGFLEVACKLPGLTCKFVNWSRIILLLVRRIKGCVKSLQYIDASVSKSDWLVVAVFHNAS